MKKVLLAMSGGLDSSMAAKILVEQGYQVAGVFLHFWKDETDPNKSENSCCSLESFLDAKSVASKIGIPLFSFDYSRQFKKEIVDYFIKSYQAGFTPNPCVACNREIKLGKLLKQAKVLGYDYLASGHYLKLIRKKGETYIYKAKDKTKDQSYFLYTLNQKQFNSLLFPLGNYYKNELRQLAKQYNLKVANKAESQDICFLNGPHNNFLKRHLKLKKGDIKLIGNTKVIGQHEGLPLYTIGQRRGINIGGSGPYYVYKLDYKKNILWVVNTWDDKSLYRKEFNISEINWTTKIKAKLPLNCQVVIRYGHLPINCLVMKGSKKDTLKVILNKNTRAITPGQSAVFYQNNRLLGGGVINKL